MNDRKELLFEIDRLLEERSKLPDGVPAMFEKLASRQHDYVLADWIRATADPARARARLMCIRDDAARGDPAHAKQALTRFNVERIHLGDMLSRDQAARDAARSEQSRRAGGASKRRRWAEVLATKLQGATKEAKWANVPESYGKLEIEEWGDSLEFWRDGERLFCNINGDEASIAKSTFFDVYLKKPD